MNVVGEQTIRFFNNFFGTIEVELFTASGINVLHGSHTG